MQRWQAVRRAGQFVELVRELVDRRRCSRRRHRRGVAPRPTTARPVRLQPIRRRVLRSLRARHRLVVVQLAVRDERPGVQDHGVPAAVVVEAEVEYRQARLSGDDDAHVVVDDELVRADEPLFVQKNGREFTQPREFVVRRADRESTGHRRRAATTRRRWHGDRGFARAAARAHHLSISGPGASTRADDAGVEAEPVHAAEVARVLDLQATIHDDVKTAARACAAPASWIYAELQPQRFRADRARVCARWPARRSGREIRRRRRPAADDLREARVRLVAPSTFYSRGLTGIMR